MTTLKSIKRPASIGLWGSVAVVILTVLFIYLAPWRFYPSQHTARWMLIAGSVLAVLAVSMTLLNIRRQVPRLRQSDDVDAKLDGYASFVRETYINMLAVVVIICLLTLFSANNVLLMLAMVCTLLLFLNYPNLYKMKADLGLTDEEMKSRFGDRYISSDQ